MISPYEKAKKKLLVRELTDELLAEAVRFELTNSVTRRQFSRLVPSTARPRFPAVTHYTYITAAPIAPVGAANVAKAANYGSSSQFSRSAVSNASAGSAGEYR